MGLLIFYIGGFIPHISAPKVANVNVYFIAEYTKKKKYITYTQTELGRGQAKLPDTSFLHLVYMGTDVHSQC